MIRRHNSQHYTYTYLYCKYHSGIDFFNFSLFELSYYMPTSIFHVGTYGKRRYTWIASLKAMMETSICNKIIIFSKESGISKYLVTLCVSDSSASILQGIVASVDVLVLRGNLVPSLIVKLKYCKTWQDKLMQNGPTRMIQWGQ